MATVNLNPNATDTNQWTIVLGGGGATAHGNLSDGAQGTGITTTTHNHICTVELDDYSAGTPITSIRHYISGFKFNTRGGDTDVRVTMMNSSGVTYYAELHTLLFNGYVTQDFYGTARTTSDGSSAWTDGNLDGMLLKIDAYEAPSAGQPLVVEAYVEVTYGAVAVTHNATFFGTNF